MAKTVTLVLTDLEYAQLQKWWEFEQNVIQPPHRAPTFEEMVMRGIRQKFNMKPVYRTFTRANTVTGIAATSSANEGREETE